jgi:hypothetical protein
LDARRPASNTLQDVIKTDPFTTQHNSIARRRDRRDDKAKRPFSRRFFFASFNTSPPSTRLPTAAPLEVLISSTLSGAEKSVATPQNVFTSQPRRANARSVSRVAIDAPFDWSRRQRQEANKIRRAFG